MASTGTAVAKPTAQAVEQVDARVQQNIEAAREAPWADEAREMWNPDNMEATDLPDTLAADWVLEYGRIRMEDGLDAPITREALAKISRLQNEIEDEYRDYLKYASDKGRNHAGLEGPARGQEDRPQIGGPDQGGSGRLEYAAAAEAETAPEPDLGTRVRSKLKAAGQNVAKAGLTDEELAEAISIYDQLGNAAKSKEVKAEQEARRQAVESPAPTPFSAPAFSKAPASAGSDVKAIAAELRKFMRVGSLGNRVVLVQAASQLPAGVALAALAPLRVRAQARGDLHLQGLVAALQGKGDRLAWL